MKKLVLLVFTFLCLTQTGNSQQREFEIGVRIGHAVSADLATPVKDHRIRTNLGWEIKYFLFDNYFDFLFPVYRDELFIYTGIGLGVRYWDLKQSNYDGFGVAALGEAGLEYRFRQPVTVGIDITPSYDFIKSVFSNYGSVSIRFRF